jgi:hypothetical protein
VEDAPTGMREDHEDEQHKVAVGTVKKSQEANCAAWLVRKVRHV